MVKIEEVADDSSSFVTEDDDASSRAGDMSDEEEHDADDDNDDALVPWSKESETLSDRFYALKDIIPPTTRQSIGLAISTTASWIKWSGLKVGNAAWIVTTTSLLVGLPLVLSIQTEGDIMAQEAQVYPPAQGVQPGVFAQPGAATGVVAPGFT